ncbi:MAG: hypothetical protein WD066_19750 [Planctomycetaceae bacterium]
MDWQSGGEASTSPEVDRSVGSLAVGRIANPSDMPPTSKFNLEDVVVDISILPFSPIPTGEVEAAPATRTTSTLPAHHRNDFASAQKKNGENECGSDDQGESHPGNFA